MQALLKITDGFATTKHPSVFLFHLFLIQVSTPNNIPLIIEIQGVQLSPYFSVNGPTLDIEFYDFTLQIPQQNEENQFSENQDQQQDNQIYHKSINHQIIPEEPQQEQNQSQEPIQNHQFSTYNLHYFNQFISESKRLKIPIQQIKQFALNYMDPDYQHFQEFYQKSLQQLIEIAKQNLRYVGPISWLQRKNKVKKYIQKKKRRVWKKKISYDCRKRVADNRLRVKGKFVTKKQACNILGVDQLEQNQIKLLLQSKATKSSD